MLNPADTAFAAHLAALLPDGTLSPPEPRYLVEPRGRYFAVGGVLARPRNSAEVATVLRACHAARVAVVPYGGGTGLVGGQISPEGPAPVILSLERMAALRQIDPVGNVALVEAGAVLADVQSAAAAVGRVFPLTLAAQGSARIGGVLATNAGGVNVLRYGTARDLCLGLEAVLADGTVIGGLKRLRKDNTGYDLRNLMIGSEGTLGVITAASLRLYPRPAGEGTMLVAVPGPAEALALLALAEARLTGCVSAFELIHRQGLEFLAETMPDLRQPLQPAPEWAVLVELGLPAGLEPEPALLGLYEAGQAAGLVSGGIIAQSGAQRAEIWRLREAIPEANKRIGSISSHDISLPLDALAGFIAQAGAALARLGDYRINCFGHLGDGNLHYNVFPAPGRNRASYDAERGAIKTLVHDLVDAMGGSISAEHGIGRMKVADLERYGDPGKLAAMRAIKAALDPRGILNPGAVLRQR
ncbi:MAG: FAD-binding oxidoreductase [Phaeovulum sp.]|uniref:FAD-binding oxidoreductase n=1 Tax=Phaeovulum sp. TaxID=2934796 RepID=UPI002731B404|nr:FAD-binding oxidoreductase [Phaeovulum sp.]MDP2062988.1 FAD-binding oxidoreductase [Phaeovulum sp.]